MRVGEARWRWPTVAGCVTLLLVSCGPTSGARPASATPSPAAAATPVTTVTPVATPSSPSPSGASRAGCVSSLPPTPDAASGPILAVTVGDTTPVTVELVTPQGHLLNQVNAAAYLGDPNADGLPEAVGVGPSGVYLFYPTTGEVCRLGVTGAPQDLGRLSPVPSLTLGMEDLAGVAESPNGKSWILSLVAWSTNEVATTSLYEGGDGVSPHILTTLTRPNQGSGGAAFGGGYAVVGWDAAGVLLGTDPTSVGGGGPFIGEGYSLGDVVELNPANQAISTPLCPLGSGVKLGALTLDGSTIACVSGQGSDVRISVGPVTGGVTSTIDTGSAFAGHVMFTGGTSSTLTYCTSDDNPPSDGSNAAWSEVLWAAPYGTSSPRPTQLMSGDNSWCEQGAVVSPNAVAELNGSTEGGEASLVTVDISTGKTTTIGAVTSILGAL